MDTQEKLCREIFKRAEQSFKAPGHPSPHYVTRYTDNPDIPEHIEAMVDGYSMGISRMCKCVSGGYYPLPDDLYAPSYYFVTVHHDGGCVACWIPKYGLLRFGRRIENVFKRIGRATKKARRERGKPLIAAHQQELSRHLQEVEKIPG
jgi:hypothetical protein